MKGTDRVRYRKVMAQKQGGDRQGKPCAACAEPIRQNAIKCKHCGSYQNWFARLNLSATVLTSLTALISVIALSAPLIRDALTPQGASFELGEPQIGPGEVVVEVRNVGKAPGTLDFAVLYIPQKTGGQPYIFILSEKGSAAEHRIQPGETKRLTFTFDRGSYDPPAVDADDPGCSLEISDQSRPVSCDEVRYLASPPAAAPSRKGELPEEGPAPLPSEAEWQRISD